MKTIAIMNNKGGVGKTVTAYNLADILAADYKQRVVLVDCDGQANLTGYFSEVAEHVADLATTADVLCGLSEPVWCDNVVPVRPGLDLLPSSSDLYGLDLDAIRDGISLPEALRHFTEAAADDGETDWMIFDCPPGYTVSSVAALLAAQEVMIPVQADAFSIQGAFSVLDQVRRAGNTHGGIKARVLMTQARNDEVVRAYAQLLTERHVPMYRTAIRRSNKVPESTGQHEPLRTYSPRSSAAIDYRSLARELMEEV